MRRKHLLLACCLCLCLPASARRYPYQNRKLSVDERVADLLQRMTLDEKIAETNLLPYYESTDSVIRAKIRAGKVGALLKANGAERNRSLQREAIRHSRLGIPLVFHEDVIHGYRTLDPIPLAESCSWDTAMVCRSAMLAAREAAASGIQLTYAPMADVSYDARWGRIMETSGEDAFLDAELAAARVRGFQGRSLADPYTVAACVKHFAGYAALLGGRDYQNTDFSQRDLFERYLPPFRAAVDAGVASVMCSYTSYDGEPVTMNRFMGLEVLRSMLKFDGLYMTDWTTFNHSVSEGAAADGKEAAMRGLQAGLEMDMSSGQYERWLGTLVKEGKVDTMLIEKAAAHALALKFRLGLFDDPYAYFGFGLSYAKFDYGRPRTDRSVYAEGDSVRVSVKVRNTGNVAAREVVQLYLRDEVATVIPREKELRGFASVLLQPGEERDVCFALPSEAFRIYNNRMERVLEPGRFQLLTGTNSEEVQACEISFE